MHSQHRDGSLVHPATVVSSTECDAVGYLRSLLGCLWRFPYGVGTDAAEHPAEVRTRRRYASSLVFEKHGELEDLLAWSSSVIGAHGGDWRRAFLQKTGVVEGPVDTILDSVAPVLDAAGVLAGRQRRGHGRALRRWSDDVHRLSKSALSRVLSDIADPRPASRPSSTSEGVGRLEATLYGPGTPTFDLLPQSGHEHMSDLTIMRFDEGAYISSQSFAELRGVGINVCELVRTARKAPSERMAGAVHETGKILDDVYREAAESADAMVDCYSLRGDPHSLDSWISRYGGS